MTRDFGKVGVTVEEARKEGDRSKKYCRWPGHGKKFPF